MPRTTKAPTLNDVARAAGVSPFTVSVVMNGSRSNTRVAEATRARILQSAAELRYRPNASARNLARQRTGTIGVLFAIVRSTMALANDYASAVLEGVVQQAAERGYDVMLHTAAWQDAAHSTGHFSDRRTDGIIVVAPTTDSDVLEGLAGIGFLPIVAISGVPELCARLGVTNADVDNALGITRAVEYLAGLGHRRIAHLSGNPNVYSATVRREAMVAAMANAGLPLPAEFLVTTTYDGLSVPDSIGELLALPQPPTAIVAGNDKIAMAVLQTVRERGLSVPDDLSVVGFDDIPAASLVTPGLTTLHQPTAALGALALDLLIARIDAASAPGDDGEPLSLLCPQRLLEPRLVVRASTGPAPP